MPAASYTSVSTYHDFISYRSLHHAAWCREDAKHASFILVDQWTRLQRDEVDIKDRSVAFVIPVALIKATYGTSHRFEGCLVGLDGTSLEVFTFVGSTVASEYYSKGVAHVLIYFHRFFKRYFYDLLGVISIIECGSWGRCIDREPFGAWALYDLDWIKSYKWSHFGRIPNAKSRDQNLLVETKCKELALILLI